MDEPTWSIEIGPPFPPVVSEGAQLVIEIGSTFNVTDAYFLFPIGGGWAEHNITEIVKIVPPET